MVPQTLHPRRTVRHWTPILMAIVVIATGVTVPYPAAARVPAAPTAGAAQTEVFTGPNFVDFWWDPANIPGCAGISLYRKASTETVWTEVATPACDAGLVTDATAVTGTAYSYQFTVKNDAEPPAPIYLDYRSATPGQVGGYLHRNLSLGGVTIQAGYGINVGAGATLTLSNATVTRGSLSDAIITDGTVREQGTIIVNGGSFDTATVSLRNAASTITGGTWTGAVVSTRAGVADGIFDASTVGISGDGTVSVSENTFTNATLMLDEGVNAQITTNTFVTGTLTLQGTVVADVTGNSLADSKVRIREQAEVTVNNNTFTGHVPDTGACIDFTGSAGVTIDRNTFNIADTTGSRAAIAIRPESTSDVAATTISNNILIGSGAGIGIQATATTGADVPNATLTDNTVARFERGVDLNNALATSRAISATVSGNTLSNNTYGLLADLHGAANSLTARNNCIAGNATAGFLCSNIDNVIAAAGNYWGHRTGPRHLTNPDGLGDRVSCSDAATEITFSPWLESHTCAISGLEIAKIEVIQSVQTLSNTMPLVAEKATVVRVYPDMGAGYAAVDGTLTGYRDDATLGTLQARSPIQAGVILDWEAARAAAEDSLIFDLPEEWLQGVVTLQADIATGGAPALFSTSAESAVLTTTASFNPRKPIKIAYIPASIDTLNGYHPVTPEDIAGIHRKILARFPLGEVSYRILPAIDRYENEISSGILPGMYFAYISGVARRWDLINNPDNVADLYITVYGTDSAEYTGSWWFYGNATGKTACGLRDEGQDCVISAGNALGLRPLIIEPEEALPPYDYDFPYADELTHEFGYDVVSGQIQSPECYDLMAYEAVQGSANWISDYHYEKLYLSLAPAAAAAAAGAVVPASATAGDYLYVSGLAGHNYRDGLFYPAVRLQNSPAPDDVTPVDPTGSTCLQARNAMNQVIESVCFNLDLTNPATGEEETMAAFTAVLTPDPDIRQLQIRYNGNLVWFLAASATPPDVTLVSASYDSTYRTAQIAWSVPLEDAPDLRYHVHYSPDNGATWTPVGIDIGPDHVQYVDGAFRWGVRAAQIPAGTQARLRLIASDGFNETVVTSAAFAVPDVGPWVDIVAPANNAVVDSFPIVLDGYAYDVESGDRTAAMMWTSSIDGALGTGDGVSVTTLSAGSHTITLAADDGDGNIGTDSIHITVTGDAAYTDWLFLPLVLR